MFTVVIVPIACRDVELLEFVRVGMERILPIRVVVSEEVLEVPEGAYDSVREQYVSEYVLSYLASRDPGVGNRVLGIADVDAYSDGLNFVFGQAELNGRYAVVYLPRLRPEFYGEPPNRKLFLERVLKECMHELGHTLGLRHCINPRCVMSFSNSVIEVDRKSPEFCSYCRRAALKVIAGYG